MNNSNKSLPRWKREKNIVSLNDDKITSSFLYYAEKLILDTAKGKGSLKSIPIAKNIDNYISFKEKEMRMLFSEEQKQVVKLANNGHNIQLQDILNAQPDSHKLIDLGLVKFHLFDKVVHITNQDMDCYLPQDFKDKNRDEKIQRKRIFNGMIGVLFQIDHKEELLWVFYSNDSLVVEYTFDEARDLLRLAYALTIHKTQGSEFRNVIIPMSYSHFIMLNNKLLYTAVTRAKEKCTIIREGYAFISACKRKDVVIRDTVMKQLEN